MYKKRLNIGLTYFAVAFYLFGADSKVIVDGPESTSYIAMPRQIVSAIFRVTSLFEDEQEFIEEIELPDGWKPLTEFIPFYIGSDEIKVRMVSFVVPSHVLADDYQVIFRVRSRQFPALSDQYIWYIQVKPNKKTEFAFVELPDMVNTGRIYDCTILLENHSNVVDTIRIGHSPSNVIEYNIPQTQFVLNPFESQDIHIKLKIKETDGNKLKSLIQLFAYSEGAPHLKKTITKSIDVIPDKLFKPDVYHRYPVNLSLKRIWHRNHDNKNGNQLNVYGNGNIDEAGRHHLKFRVRTPDLYDTSVLGEYSEYYGLYTHDHWYIGLGDQNFSVSSLLESSSYSRGANLVYRSDKYSAGAYYAQTRFIFQKEKQYASYLQYNLNKLNYMKLNYLWKNHLYNNEEKSSHLLSVESEIMINRKTRLATEFALTTNYSNNKAYLFELNGGFRKSDYGVKYMDANRNFYGYYTNRKLSSGHFRYQLTNRLNSMIQLNEYENRYYSDSTIVKILGSYQDYGLRYQLLNGFAITASYGGRTQKDQQETPRFDFKDRMATLQLTHQQNKFSATTRFEYGKTFDYIRNKRENMGRINLNVQYRPNETRSFQLYFLYDKTGFSNISNRQQYNIGLQTNFEIWNRTSISLNLQNYFTVEDYYSERNVLDFRIDKSLNDKHAITFRLRETLQKNDLNSKEIAILAQYNYLLNAPIMRKKNIGHISGMVIDHNIGQPLSGILMKVNGCAVRTDKDGHFFFDGLNKGIYYLEMDRASIGLDRICHQKLPVGVEVNPGLITNVNLSVVKSSQIHGKVVLYQVVNDSSDHFAAEEMPKHMDEYYITGKNRSESSYITNSKTKLIPIRGVPNILIELKDDDRILRRITNHNGDFSFQDLSFGDWKITLSNRSLPDLYQFEKETYTVLLEQGMSEYVFIRVIPKQRKIRFLENAGEVIQVKP